jgi:site-specific DNA-methyltransferase (adenine-specific)
LLARIIQLCSNEGEVVLDPFAGTGTTLAVAKKLRRQYLGFDISNTYAKNGRARLRGINPGDPLDGVDNPLASVPDTTNGRVRTADGRRGTRNAASSTRRSKRRMAM